MNRWELVDSGPVPGSESVMSLLRSGRELAIHVDERQLMSSLIHGSEDALADLAADRVGQRPEARFLVGGLGMGFTLAQALRRLGEDATVEVAELVPSIVKWNRGPLGPVAGEPLNDPRASVYLGDVADRIRAAPAAWDAILLDVDNGPTGLTRESNNWLYTPAGLAAASAALRPGGVLAVWSAWPDPAFTRRMQRADYEVRVEEVRSRGKQGGHRHVVWVGVRA